jgi:hypothetical protein
MDNIGQWKTEWKKGHRFPFSFPLSTAPTMEKRMENGGLTGYESYREWKPAPDPTVERGFGLSVGGGV